MNVRRGVSRPGRQIQKWLLVISLGILGIWLAFFDSHSLARRISWHREANQVTRQNEHLRQDIERLEQQIEEAQTDEVVEKIAREQYGMRRPGERVYRARQVEGR